MSHTTRLKNGWIAIHDGDFRGDVNLRQVKEHINSPEGVIQEITVPIEAVFAFVAEAVRRHKASQLDDASDNEILGLK